MSPTDAKNITQPEFVRHDLIAVDERAAFAVEIGNEDLIAMYANAAVKGRYRGIAKGDGGRPAATQRQRVTFFQREQSALIGAGYDQKFSSHQQLR